MQDLPEVAIRILEAMGNAFHVLENRHHLVAQLVHDVTQSGIARECDKLVLHQYRRLRTARGNVNDTGADQTFLDEPRRGVLAYPPHIVVANGHRHLHARIVGERQMLDLANIESTQLDRRTLGNVMGAVGQEVNRGLGCKHFLLDADRANREHDAENGNEHERADLAFEVPEVLIRILHDGHIGSYPIRCTTSARIFSDMASSGQRYTETRPGFSPWKRCVSPSSRPAAAASRPTVRKS